MPAGPATPSADQVAAGGALDQAADPSAGDLQAVAGRLQGEVVRHRRGFGDPGESGRGFERLQVVGAVAAGRDVAGDEQDLGGRAAHVVQRRAVAPGLLDGEQLARRLDAGVVDHPHGADRRGGELHAQAHHVRARPGQRVGDEHGEPAGGAHVREGPAAALRGRVAAPAVLLVRVADVGGEGGQALLDRLPPDGGAPAGAGLAAGPVQLAVAPADVVVLGEEESLPGGGQLGPGVAPQTGQVAQGGEDLGAGEAALRLPGPLVGVRLPGGEGVEAVRRLAAVGRQGRGAGHGRVERGEELADGGDPEARPPAEGAAGLGLQGLRRGRHLRLEEQQVGLAGHEHGRDPGRPGAAGVQVVELRRHPGGRFGPQEGEGPAVRPGVVGGEHPRAVRGDPPVHRLRRAEAGVGQVAHAGAGQDLGDLDGVPGQVRVLRHRQAAPQVAPRPALGLGDDPHGGLAVQDLLHRPGHGRADLEAPLVQQAQHRLAVLRVAGEELAQEEGVLDREAVLGVGPGDLVHRPADQIDAVGQGFPDAGAPAEVEVGSGDDVHVPAARRRRCHRSSIRSFLGRSLSGPSVSLSGAMLARLTWRGQPAAALACSGVGSAPRESRERLLLAGDCAPGPLRRGRPRPAQRGARSGV